MLINHIWASIIEICVEKWRTQSLKKIEIQMSRHEKRYRSEAIAPDGICFYGGDHIFVRGIGKKNTADTIFERKTKIQTPLGVQSSSNRFRGMVPCSLPAHASEKQNKEET